MGWSFVMYIVIFEKQQSVKTKVDDNAGIAAKDLTSVCLLSFGLKSLLALFCSG
jgi:hypothetical protein